jgi:hypothetical protein
MATRYSLYIQPLKKVEPKTTFKKGWAKNTTFKKGWAKNTTFKKGWAKNTTFKKGWAKNNLLSAEQV